MASQLKDLDLRASLIILLLSFLWGGQAVALKAGLYEAPPLAMGWLRYSLGGVTVYLWARWRGLPVWPARGAWGAMGVICALFVVNIAFQNFGASWTSAGHSAVLQNVYSLHMVLLAHFFIPGDRLTWRKGAGCLLAYGGVWLLLARPEASGGATLAGDLMISASALLLGVRIVATSILLQRIPPTALLIPQAVLGALVFVAASLAWEDLGTIRWSPVLIASALYQGVLIAGFNYIVFTFLLRDYRPGGMGPLFMTTPLFGVALSALILGEPITWRLAASALLLGLGIAASGRAA